MEPTSLDQLTQELWRLIFHRVPHVSRLQCLCVSQKWYKFLKELEEDLAEANPGSARLLLLEKEGYELDIEEENRLQWSALDPVTFEKTSVKLSWPPGWDPAVHGCIRGGGPSGLVALWDSKASQYWIGSPVHDKWEKVTELNVFRHLSFHRRGFHLIEEKSCDRRMFCREPAVPCFTPAEKSPPEGESCRKERCGFYHIVQFQWNETHERWPVHDRKFANWVIQVYSSRSRTWKILEEPAPRFRSLIHSCVSGNRVYFLAAQEPRDEPPWYVDHNTSCPLSVWVYEWETAVLSLKVDRDVENDEIKTYWRSMQLRVSKGGDIRIISVGHPRGQEPDEWSLYQLGVGNPSGVHPSWIVEKQIELDELFYGDQGFDELIDSDSEDWSYNLIAFNPTEGYLDDLYGRAHAERKTMYAEKEYLDHCAEEISEFTYFMYFSKPEGLWKCWNVVCPLYKDGVLPIVPFLPCCSLPCCA